MDLQRFVGVMNSVLADWCSYVKVKRSDICHRNAGLCLGMIFP